MYSVQIFIFEGLLTILLQLCLKKMRQYSKIISINILSKQPETAADFLTFKTHIVQYFVQVLIEATKF
jgi:hypothetical protein